MTFKNKNYIDNLIKTQKNFFCSNKTKNINFRIDMLIKLKKLILKTEKEIMEALYNDLGKSNFESYTTEIGIILSELSYTIKNLKKWSKPKKVKTSVINFKSSSYIYPEPYGNCLIISPWNYPFQLTLAPLIGSIAGGNTTILKPSEYSPYTSKIIQTIINENFETGYIYVTNGGIETNQTLLDKKFDYIFYTGGTRVGKIVMEKASKYLTPLTLELGGKSPCIIDKEGDIELFAKRIVWGKFLNSGQTCVAPDYILVHKDIKQILIKHMINYIKQFYGENPKGNKDYVKIINEKHFNRLTKLLENTNIIYGGKYDKQSLYISPTLIDNIDWNHPIMKDEIFGPIFPILEYKNLEEVIEIVNNHSKPLALYFFTSNKQNEKQIITNISFGGGCINDTIMHLTSPHLPFGGVGYSGMGSYHGKKSFDTFTHYKSILKRSNIIDLNLRYPPYDGKLKTIKKFLK